MYVYTIIKTDIHKQLKARKKYTVNTEIIRKEKPGSKNESAEV